MKQRLPGAFYNPLSLTGLIIAVFNTGFIIFLSIVEVFSGRAHPYADLIIWLVLPVFVLVGVVLIIAGIRRERRKEAGGVPGARRLLVVDLNNPAHRKSAVIAAAGFLFLSLLYAFAGFKTYEFTESETFCGQMCHQVMGPEMRSYSYSVHAEVACADCHVGPGAKYFLFYKLKGTRQLFDVLTDRYPRPIPTPVADLRPSQDVCENCHGPKYQINQRLESRTYFLADEKNSPWTLNLLLRMGRADVTADRPLKMHWHYSTTEEIVYVATDRERNVIPWIRVKRLDGKERIYRSTEAEVSDAELAKADKRKMDCVDCHNRSGHPYRPPDVIVNALLNARVIDPALPRVKRVAVDALDGEYSSRDEARAGIAATIMEFYRKTYPEIASGSGAAIAGTIKALQGVYERNYDPHMQVNWKNFPDNQGHRFAPGCFRCHDGKHRSEDGTVLSRDCSLCHLLIERVVERGADGVEKAAFQVMKNPHPSDIGDEWKETLCHECHGAGN